MAMLSAVPSLPVSEIKAAVDFYTTRLPFHTRHQDDDFAIVAADAVELHLWAADKPEVPGAEPHLAGSGSCSVRVDDAAGFHDVCRRAGVVHPNGALARKPWGTSEFTVIDPDNNCIRFYELLPG